MVYIPGGSFLMDSPENEEGITKIEGPRHKVVFQPFYISKYRITQTQYQLMMGKDSSHFKERKLFGKNSEGGKCPVECVA